MLEVAAQGLGKGDKALEGRVSIGEKGHGRAAAGAHVLQLHACGVGAGARACKPRLPLPAQLRVQLLPDSQVAAGKGCLPAAHPAAAPLLPASAPMRPLQKDKFGCVKC